MWIRKLVVASLVLVPGIAACHTYLPVDGAVVPKGSVVRVQVDGETARYVEGLTSRSEADRRFKGEVLESNPDSLLLAVTVALRENSPRMETISQRVALERRQILSMEIRQPDRVRTGAAVALVGALVAGVVVKILTGKTGGSNVTAPPPPSDARLPSPRSWGCRVFCVSDLFVKRVPVPRIP
ncbi:MAG: hypothetical protein Q8N53_06605 [Longimicrobiales bacterium]|nr:hypothetical protein [Longimicrobiales bacterium]